MELIHIIISILATFITTIVPFALALINRSKACNEEKADADLLARAKDFITEAEVVYSGMDKLMKPQGDSAGGVKRENVFIKLQAYALQHKYSFDAEKWSRVIDDLVGFSKKVNVK